MMADEQRTKPEHHKLFYVSDDTGMVFLTHFMKDDYRQNRHRRSLAEKRLNTIR